jgi:hypothetical protein
VIVLALLAAVGTALAALVLRRAVAERLESRLAAVGRSFLALEDSGALGALPASARDTLLVQRGYLSWALPVQRASWKVWLFSSFRRDLGRFEAALAALRADPSADPFRGAAGTILRGFRSPTDGDLASYSVRVPDGYDPARPWPLILHLHGYVGSAPYQGHPAPDYGGDALVLAPHGKGAADFMGPAEADVLAALADAVARYRVDGRRVYLAGASMGGTGAWHLAAHHPDRFAALAAASANADARVWDELWERRRLAPPPAGSVGEAIARLKELDSPITYAGNLLHVPALVLHGDADEVVPVEHSRRMVAALRAAGCTVEYRELRGEDHGIGYAGRRREIAEWLLRHRHEERPVRVRCATDGRWPGAGWLGRAVPAQVPGLAEADARIEPDGKTVMVATRNCAGLTLGLDEAPLAGTEATVVIDGHKFQGLPRGAASFRKGPEGWALAGEGGPGRPPELADLFREQFLVVYGTGAGDARLNAMLRREAEAFVEGWRRRFAARPALYADTEVPGEALRGSGLLLFGGPEENSLTRRVLERASPPPPLRFEPGRCGLETPSGPAVAEGPTAGAEFCWPNPLAPGRLFGVVWGASWRALVDVNGRFGAGFNWSVYANRQWFGFALFDEKTASPESFLAVGLWDRGPRLSAKLLWRRAGAGGEAPGGAPCYWSVEDAPRGQPLPLDELRPAEIIQAGGPVGFGRSWGGGELAAGGAGRRFARGLGVRAPSRLVFEIAGRFRRFTAVVGADLQGRSAAELSAPRLSHGRMGFVVRGDGRELAGVGGLGPGDGPREVGVSVAGVRRLELEVLPEGRYPWHVGPAAWAEARLEP